MRVENVMTRDVITVGPEVAVHKAARGEPILAPQITTRRRGSWRITASAGCR